jgi:hypothetical protein
VSAVPGGSRDAHLAAAVRTVGLVEGAFGPESEEAAYARIYLDRMHAAGEDYGAFFAGREGADPHPAAAAPARQA